MVRSVLCSRLELVTQLNMAHDLYTVIESMGWMYRLFGSFPLILKGPVGSRQYALSTALVTYNIIFYLVVVKLFSDCLGSTLHTFDVGNLKFLMIFTRLLENVLTASDFAIIRIIYCKTIISNLNILSMQDKVLNKFGHSFNYKVRARLTALLTIVTSIIICGLINADLYAQDFAEILILRIVANINFFIHYANILLFAMLLLNVGSRFVALNKLIEYNDALSEDATAAMEFLCDLAEVHAHLCNVAKSFIKIFTLTILISIAGAFVYVTTILYYVFVSMKYGIATVGAANFCSMISVLILNVFLVLSIVLSCSWTSCQANKTIEILQRLGLKNLNDEKNNPLINVTRHFSMQVLHHNLIFTTAGLFSLDSSLLQSLASAVTTYLVILIQFEPQLT
ncbi:putative gustatory receptor 28b [Trichogramma pretiosum]|uniref:putative gustatory receptor 28b n=1 Tax=Trichogramma pretiosum TaxID=7493 RepID=UPI000C71BF2C|nr:putative gustatory receptor 28b [Trichogramma pretiosum]